MRHQLGISKGVLKNLNKMRSCLKFPKDFFFSNAKFPTFSFTDKNDNQKK